MLSSSTRTGEGGQVLREVPGTPMGDTAWLGRDEMGMRTRRVMG